MKMSKYVTLPPLQQVRKTVMREVRILKELKHPNIVNLIEVFRWKGKIFLVFEYVPHTLLEELENNPRGLSDHETQKYIWQLIRGLEFIHSHNVVHRDIKPENLLISKHGILKICDFGFARFLAGPDSLYTDYVSTRWYRAPELLVGDANYAQGIDLWAIGCLLVELATGQPLFPGESDLKTLQLIMSIVGGKLTEKQRKTLQQNPIFDGMEPLRLITSGSSSGSIEQKFAGISGIELVKACLQIDPANRPNCTQLLESEYFEGKKEELRRELNEIMQKDAAEFQMRTKLNAVPADAGPLLDPPPPSEIKVENSDIEEEASECEDGVAMPNTTVTSKPINKVNLAFMKPRNDKEHNSSYLDLNSSFLKRTSTKVPPGGGAGPNTMLLREHNHPALLSRKTFKDIADFQNPPAFLKTDLDRGLPQLKGKSISSTVVQNGAAANTKVNRLVALPNITEVRSGGEKLYLKNGAIQKNDKGLENSFDENSGAGNCPKVSKKGTMFPNIQSIGPGHPVNFKETQQKQKREQNPYNPQLSVKIMDLQHNLMPFEKSTVLLVDGGARIDAHSLKKQLFTRKVKGNLYKNKPITPLSDMAKMGKSNPLIHYGHQLFIFPHLSFNISRVIKYLYLVQKVLKQKKKRHGAKGSNYRSEERGGQSESYS
eukprot:TRINITY_DN70908_c0_g1_i1.p1 TRINITY_DN70908_c0_g1~~TRINITY_DN70908_c0_g1_i1.p1  ORF type:complete len:658 (-),score=51.12 TRINITY_DN70908_c0_g1_i1:1739-3712(-)